MLTSAQLNYIEDAATRGIDCAATDIVQLCLMVRRGQAIEAAARKILPILEWDDGYAAGTGSPEASAILELLREALGAPCPK